MEDQHHNTTDLSGDTLDRIEEKAKTQSELVLEHFKSNPEKDFTPDEILEALIDADKIHKITPITSIRRSISNLTKEDYLQKTDEKRKGNFGRLTYAWKLKRQHKVGYQTSIKL